MTPEQTRDALVREMNELADQIASAGINSFSHRVLLLSNRLAALPVGDAEPVAEVARESWCGERTVRWIRNDNDDGSDLLTGRYLYLAPPPAAVPNYGLSGIPQRLRDWLNFKAEPPEGELWMGYESARADALRLAQDPAAVPAGCPPHAEIYVGDGHFAIVDWADWDLVKSYNWNLTARDVTTLYAQAWSSSDMQTRRRITMHRIIVQAPKDKVIDHINGNGLDNRRANLRIVTPQQNAFNQRGHGGSSKFKGVSFDKETGLWRAYITRDGKRRTLGRFASELDAAKAYNKSATELFGEHAKQNNLD